MPCPRCRATGSSSRAPAPTAAARAAGASTAPGRRRPRRRGPRLDPAAGRSRPGRAPGRARRRPLRPPSRSPPTPLRPRSGSDLHADRACPHDPWPPWGGASDSRPSTAPGPDHRSRDPGRHRDHAQGPGRPQAPRPRPGRPLRPRAGGHPHRPRRRASGSSCAAGRGAGRGAGLGAPRARVSSRSCAPPWADHGAGAAGGSDRARPGPRGRGSHGLRRRPGLAGPHPRRPPPFSTCCGCARVSWWWPATAPAPGSLPAGPRDRGSAGPRAWPRRWWPTVGSVAAEPGPEVTVAFARPRATGPMGGSEAHRTGRGPDRRPRVHPLGGPLGRRRGPPGRWTASDGWPGKPAAQCRRPWLPEVARCLDGGGPGLVGRAPAVPGPARRGPPPWPSRWWRSDPKGDGTTDELARWGPAGWGWGPPCLGPSPRPLPWARSCAGSGRSGRDSCVTTLREQNYTEGQGLPLGGRSFQSSARDRPCACVTVPEFGGIGGSAEVHMSVMDKSVGEFDDDDEQEEALGSLMLRQWAPVSVPCASR